MKYIKISVVTVSYNAVETIERTMLSIINQTYKNVEYIIIDGGSTDGTVDIIKKYANRLTYWISEPDGGIYDAMNKGINKATGDYINFMNAGDIFTNNMVLNNVAQCLHKDTDILYGDNQLIYDSSIIYNKAHFFSSSDTNLPFNHQSTFVRTELAKQRHFNLKYKIAGDYDFFYELYKMGKNFQYLPIPIANYAMNGLSQHNIIKLYNEVYSIQGRKQNYIFYIKILLIYIKNIAKFLLPEHIITKYRRLK